MKCNYHNHTYRCGHASGTEDEYIKKAISEGIQVLGFSDHTPYIFPDGFVSYSRMDISDMPGYFSTLLALREKYRGYIEIYIGFEAEYYPRYFDALLAEYRKYPLEYLIYAGHNIGNEGAEDCFCGFDRTSDPARLTAYTDMAIRAMQTGRFTFIAHPDMLPFEGDIDLYRSESERLCREAKRLGVPLEINLNGIRDRRHYPNPEFWAVAGRVGNDAVIGFDAHTVKHVADRGEIIEGLRFADKYKLNVLDKLKLRDPLKVEN